MRKHRQWNGNKPSGSGGSPEKTDTPRQKSFTLTMFNHAKPEALPELDRIFSKHSGDHRVYLKIVSPKNWETVLATDRHVLPSEEMLGEVRDLMGKDALLGMHGFHNQTKLKDNSNNLSAAPADNPFNSDI